MSMWLLWNLLLFSCRSTFIGYPCYALMLLVHFVLQMVFWRASLQVFWDHRKALLSAAASTAVIEQYAVKEESWKMMIELIRLSLYMMCARASASASTWRGQSPWPCRYGSFNILKLSFSESFDRGVWHEWRPEVGIHFSMRYTLLPWYVLISLLMIHLNLMTMRLFDWLSILD